MFKLMLKNLWTAGKKQLMVCILCTIALLAVAVRIQDVLMAILNGSLPNGLFRLPAYVLQEVVAKTVKGEDGSLISMLQINRAVRYCVSVCVLCILYVLMKSVPLRICRGMFICAAGEKERREYLFGQIAVKMALSFVYLFAVLMITTGGFFLEKSAWVRSIQLLLWFFTLLNLNLKVGIGIKGARKMDRKGYAIYSRAETAVNIYWFGLLIIQNVIFYTLAATGTELSGISMGAGIAAVLLINGFMMVRYLVPMLKEALSYEDVYRQEPEPVFETYDI